MLNFLKEEIKKIIEAGYQLSADGFEFLKNIEKGNIEQFVKQAIKTANTSNQDVLIFDKSFLYTVQQNISKKRVFLTPKIIGKPIASEYDEQIQVLNDYKSETSGDINDFVEYFRNRYKKIEKILHRRIDVRDAVTIGVSLNLPLKSKVKIIGIVTNKRTSGPRLFLELEDMEDSITIMASDKETVRKGLLIQEDQVICVAGLKYREDLFIANDFIWPDIPSQPPKRSDIPICAAFLADVHVGSKYFEKDLFHKFIRWMNIEVGPPEYKRLASKVKYVIIAGDLVDGIGVFPNQIEELAIKDVREQYEAAANMLFELPDYVEIIVMPGNHDAVRNSLPQPPISKEYAEKLYENDRIHSFGNPCRLLLNGVEAFICHGKSLDDLLSQTPGFKFQKPIDGLELLLKSRHVAPRYGASTPIAPEREDRLVIMSTPDIFQMGHVHVHGFRKYKGTTLIASGSWQSQTPFQKRVNLDPTVGIASIVDLQTHNVMELNFKGLN